MKSCSSWDVVIYADLLAARLGMSLNDFVMWKFNEVSLRRGSRRLFGGWDDLPSKLPLAPL